MGYNLPINGVYWGHNPLTNLLLTSWHIQVERWVIWEVRQPTYSSSNIFYYPHLPNLFNVLT